MTNRLAGIDVGGTFTDLLFIDDSTRDVRLAKVPSTIDNQAFGVLNALAAADVELGSLDLLVHGTTTTINALRNVISRVPGLSRRVDFAMS